MTLSCTCARFSRLILVVLATQLLFLFAAPLRAQLTTRPLVHNGYSRPYLVYRPAQTPPHPAMVLMLGGAGSTAQLTSEEFQWARQAEQHHFLVVYPEPVATNLSKPIDRHTNLTFWDLKGSRTHLVPPGMPPVDDEGYLLAVLRDALHRERAARRQVFLAGFSSGSGMVQLFAAHHPELVDGIVAVATPLMEPPLQLARPVPILYIHGDDDEQFSGFEVNSPHFATTPHGNWVTWGSLDGCRGQQAARVDGGIRFSWQQCKGHVPVVALFVAHLGHDWPGSLSSHWNDSIHNAAPLDLTATAWEFFASLPGK
ncbi:MAG TPA: hypothetical protein VGD62_10925 [Acidobacteriaceae bacterium]